MIKMPMTLVIWGICILNFIQAIYGNDYYNNEFESHDDLSFWMTGSPVIKSLNDAVEKQFLTVNYKGIVSRDQKERACNGMRSLKFDITLNSPEDVRHKFNLWQATLKKKIKLDKDIWLSGYLLLGTNLHPGTNISIGLNLTQKNIKDNKTIASYTVPIREEKYKAENGWWFFEKNFFPEIKKFDLSKTYFVIDSWYIVIENSDMFLNERLVFYLDDIKIKSEKEKVILPLSKQNFNRIEIYPENPYIVACLSYFKDKNNSHNLIENSSFELGMKNWEVSDVSYSRTNWLIDSNEFCHGEKSLKIYRPDKSFTTAVIRSQIIEIENGQKYTLSCWAKSEEPSILILGGREFHLSKEWKRYYVSLALNGITHPSYTRDNLYYIEIKSNAKCAVWIDNVQVEKGKLTEYKYPSRIEVGLNTESMTNVYFPNQDIIIYLCLFNGKNEKINSTVEMKVWDFEHKLLFLEAIPFEIFPFHGLTKKININYGKKFYKIEASINGSWNERERDNVSIGVISPLKNTSENSGKNFFWGLFSCGCSYGNLDLQFSLYKEAGCKHFSGINLSAFRHATEDWQKNRETFRKLENYFKLTHKYDMTLTPMLHGFPDWTGINNKPFEPGQLSDTALKAWSDYCYKLAEHFKGRISSWSIWGEFITKLEMGETNFKIIENTYDTIKNVIPNSTICGCAEDSARGWCLIPELESHFKYGSLKYMDVVGINPYCYPVSPEAVEYPEMLDQLQAKIKHYNNGIKKPLWVSEVGYKGIDILYYDLCYAEGKIYSSFVTELQQAQYTIRQMLISLAKGVERFGLFSFDPYSIVDICPYSLLNYGGTSPKIIYIAYNNMVSILRDSVFKKEIKLSKDIFCYQFEDSSKSPIIIIWNSNLLNNIIKYPLNQENIHFEMLNMLGETLEKQYLTISGSPVYLRFDSAITGKELNDFVEKLQYFLSPKLKIETCWNSGNNSINVILINNDSKFSSGQISLTNSKGMTLSSNPHVEYNILPKDKKEILFNFDKIDSSSSENEITIKQIMKQECWAKRYNPVFINFTPNNICIDGIIDNNEWKNVTPIQLGAKERKSLYSDCEYKGNADLSAWIYLLWDCKNLYIGIKVWDNICNFPFVEDHRIWANDALQIAFTKSDKPGYAGDAIEFGVSLVGEKIMKHQWIGQTSEIQNIKTAIMKDTEGLTYELMIPWKIFKNFNINTGENLRFAIAITDNDGEYETYPQYKGLKQWLELGGGIVGPKQSDKFKDIFLVKKN